MGYVFKKKPTFVLMAGFPATGKTTLANTLKRRLGWEVIDKDEIKEKYMHEGLSDERAAWYAYEGTFTKVSISLNITKLSVILDSSAMRYFVWEEAQKMAHNSGADLKVLHCIVDNDVRLRRLHQRNARISQQNISTYTIKPDLAQFTHLPNNAFIVDTQRISEESLKKIENYLMQ